MISLREFAYEIRQRIDDGKSIEAVPLAQYLLRRHPRYLRGYQLLAEAALEQGNLTDAIEIFSRVLSADPESFAAHAGLASAYTDQNELDNALWHMTRAFESEPGMKAVRDQLRYLYELRDGRAPGRLHLNSAALARSYLRNGAFDVAVEEFQHEIEADPDRIDLQVALAEAYWFANHPQQAAQVAFQVLEELPLALKPHLILGAFYHRAGEMEQAETHLRIAQELDPENDIAINIFGEGTPFRAIAIPIDEPANITKGTAPLGGAQLPEWLRDLSLFAAPEAPTDGVDWDAIIAYEDDWRTQLGNATRDAISAYKPNWRANLRLATIRALRERGVEYPALPAEAEPAIVETSQPTSDWRDTLYSDTVTAFVESDLSPVIEAETETQAPYDVEETWQPDEPTTEIAPLLAPEWKATLRFATEEAIAAHEVNGGDEELLELPDNPTVYLPELLFPPADTAEWVHSLRDASELLISPVEANGIAIEAEETAERLEAELDMVARVAEADPAILPRQRLTGRWIPTLRVSTEIWLAMQRRSGGRGTDTLVPPSPEPEFFRTEPSFEKLSEPVKAETVNPQITDAEEAGEFDTEPIEAAPEVTDTYTADTLVDEGEMVESDDAPSDDTEPLDILDLAEAAAEDREADVAFETVEPTTETDDTSTAVEIAEPVALTPLQAAQYSWQNGEVKQAVGQYQMLFYEESVPDEELSTALAEWVATDTAPALIYQLLGDVYRRMGRMQDAVAHYREAINRM